MKAEDSEAAAAIKAAGSRLGVSARYAAEKMQDFGDAFKALDLACREHAKAHSNDASSTPRVDTD